MANLRQFKNDIKKYGCNKMCNYSHYKALICLGFDSEEFKKQDHEKHTRKQAAKVLEIFNNCMLYKCYSHRKIITDCIGNWTDKYHYRPDKFKDKFEWKTREFKHQFDKIKGVR